MIQVDIAILFIGKILRFVEYKTKIMAFEVFKVLFHKPYYLIENKLLKKIFSIQTLEGLYIFSWVAVEYFKKTRINSTTYLKHTISASCSLKSN